MSLQRVGVDLGRLHFRAASARPHLICTFEYTRHRQLPCLSAPVSALIMAPLGLDLASKRQRKRSDYYFFRTYRLRWSDNDVFGHVNVSPTLPFCPPSPPPDLNPLEPLLRRPSRQHHKRLPRHPMRLQAPPSPASRDNRQHLLRLFR